MMANYVVPGPFPDDRALDILLSMRGTIQTLLKMYRFHSQQQQPVMIKIPRVRKGCERFAFFSKVWATPRFLAGSGDAGHCLLVQRSM